MMDLAPPPNYPALPNLPNVPQPVVTRVQTQPNILLPVPPARDAGQLKQGSNSSNHSLSTKSDIDDSIFNAIKTLEPIEQSIYNQPFERNPEKLFSVQVTQMKVVNHIVALNKLNYTHSKLSLWPEEFGDEPFSHDNRFVAVDISFFGLFNEDGKTAYNIFIYGYNDLAPVIPLLTIFNEDTPQHVFLYLQPLLTHSLITLTGRSAAGLRRRRQHHYLHLHG